MIQTQTTPSTCDENAIPGSPTFTYNGTLDDLILFRPTVYTNNTGLDRAEDGRDRVALVIWGFRLTDLPRPSVNSAPPVCRKTTVPASGS
jgi:hypothetical protein